MAGQQGNARHLQSKYERIPQGHDRGQAHTRAHPAFTGRKTVIMSEPLSEMTTSVRIRALQSNCAYICRGNRG